MGGCLSHKRGYYVPQTVPTLPVEKPSGVSEEKIRSVQKTRRKSVSAECVTGAEEEADIRVIPKSQEEATQIKQNTRGNFLFEDLEEEQLDKIIDAMEVKEVAEGETIIVQGDPGDNFYLIKSGVFQAIVDGMVVFTYENEGAFGELALMYNCPRAATIVAKTDGVLYAVDRHSFRHLVVKEKMRKAQLYEKFLNDVPLLSSLTPAQRAKIADCLYTERYSAGETVVAQNEPLTSNSNFYIVEQGVVECFVSKDNKDPKLVKTVKEGGHFGELALITQEPRAATCTAQTDVRLLAMSRDAFERLIGETEDIFKDSIAEYRIVNAAL